MHNTEDTYLLVNLDGINTCAVHNTQGALAQGSLYTTQWDE